MSARTSMFSALPIENILSTFEKMPEIVVRAHEIAMQASTETLGQQLKLVDRLATIGSEQASAISDASDISEILQSKINGVGQGLVEVGSAWAKAQVITLDAGQQLYEIGRKNLEEMNAAPRAAEA